MISTSGVQCDLQQTCWPLEICHIFNTYVGIVRNFQHKCWKSDIFPTERVRWKPDFSPMPQVGNKPDFPPICGIAKTGFVAGNAHHKVWTPSARGPPQRLGSAVGRGGWLFLNLIILTIAGPRRSWRLPRRRIEHSRARQSLKFLFWTGGNPCPHSLKFHEFLKNFLIFFRNS